MARYRSTLSERELNYSDSGGPIVGPGQEFDHDIPTDQLADHLRMGIIAPVLGEGELILSREQARALFAIDGEFDHFGRAVTEVHVRLDEHD
jgi:hypothetical protein